ncbi:MAG: chorismate mutase [Proteobacteria bacterium]|nr:chorismate mutase [Pseudomonadota bacterium]
MESETVDEDLGKLRERLDEIDASIVTALAARQEVVSSIADAKGAAAAGGARDEPVWTWPLTWRARPSRSSGMPRSSPPAGTGADRLLKKA